MGVSHTRRSYPDQNIRSNKLFQSKTPYIRHHSSPMISITNKTQNSISQDIIFLPQQSVISQNFNSRNISLDRQNKKKIFNPQKEERGCWEQYYVTCSKKKRRKILK